MTQDRSKTAPRRFGRGAFFASNFVFDFGRFGVRFWLPLGALLEVKIGHFGHRFLIDFLMLFQDRPKSRQERPRASQEPPKSLPRAPKSGLRGAQERPREPQERPRAAQERPRAAKRDPRAAKSVPRAAQEPLRVTKIVDFTYV